MGLGGDHGDAIETSGIEDTQGIIRGNGGERRGRAGRNRVDVILRRQRQRRGGRGLQGMHRSCPTALTAVTLFDYRGLGSLGNVRLQCDCRSPDN